MHHWVIHLWFPPNPPTTNLLYHGFHTYRASHGAHCFRAITSPCITTMLLSLKSHFSDGNLIPPLSIFPRFCKMRMGNPWIQPLVKSGLSRCNVLWNSRRNVLWNLELLELLVQTCVHILSNLNMNCSFITYKKNLNYRLLDNDAEQIKYTIFWHSHGLDHSSQHTMLIYR